jgi:truncated hemoglobin YjbI
MTDLTPAQLERRELIAQLFGAFGRTPKEHEYTGYEAALRLMPTPILARVVSSWLEKIAEATEPEDLRVPTAGKLWQLKRKLRALPTPAPLTLHGAPPQKLDGWDTNANLFLLNYVTRGLVEQVVHDRTPTRNASRYAPAAHTAVLTKWKSIWARDMREDRELYEGQRDGKAYWLECMRLAEAEIDALIAAEQAAA